MEYEQLKELIEQIKDSFQKIQKATEYARPFSIEEISGDL